MSTTRRCMFVHEHRTQYITANRNKPLRDILGFSLAHVRSIFHATACNYFAFLIRYIEAKPFAQQCNVITSQRFLGDAF